MFTGIVSDIGQVVARDVGRLTIACNYDPASFADGASVACDGCCLTVVAFRKQGQGMTFDVDISPETADRTTLGDWQPGRRINLERSLALGAELGGHVVLGHIDGRARILSVDPDGDSRRIRLDTSKELSKFIAEKGSVALDGVSLTVNEVDGTTFGVNLIPFTLAHTTWGERTQGDPVNLEVDVLARYVGRMRQCEMQP